MRHIWSVLCSKGITDKKTNNVSLIEIIEEMKLTTEIQGKSEEFIESGMFGQTPADWVTLWVRSNIEEPEKATVKDSILSPSGKVIVEKEYEINLQSFKRNRIMRKVLVPPAQENGMFLFLTQVKNQNKQTWETVGETPLYVTIGKTEPTKDE